MSYQSPNKNILILMKTRHSTALTCVALMIGTLLLAFASCRKSPNTIGNNLIGESEYMDIFHTDTVAIVCHSYLDSVNTTNPSNALLGATKDPVLGTTEAGFFTQFRFSVAGQSFGANPVLDSLVLQLSLTGCYGDTSALQTVHVYELADSLSSSESYYNHSVVATHATDHANGYQFRPHPRTMVNVVGTDTLVQPILRIPLSQELGNQLLTLDTTVFSLPNLFKAQFPGLYVTCSPVDQNGSICYINLTNNEYTLLQLYYHDASTPDKPMRYNYYVTSSDVYFNHMDHDYTQGDDDFTSQVLDGQTALGQQQLYLQTMGGVRTFVKFPNLEHWADTLEDCHMVINEAKLVVPVAPASLDSVYTAPKTFLLVGFNADSTTYLLPDYFEGNSYFGGTYNSSRQCVTFRISEYLQSVIMGKNENNGLSLGINGASYNAHRMVVNGPEATEGEKLHLEVTYSIVKE